jgi:hypothetical protein
MNPASPFFAILNSLYIIPKNLHPQGVMSQEKGDSHKKALHPASQNLKTTLMLPNRKSSYKNKI